MMCSRRNDRRIARRCPSGDWTSGTGRRWSRRVRGCRFHPRNELRRRSVRSGTTQSGRVVAPGSGYGLSRRRRTWSGRSTPGRCRPGSAGEILVVAGEVQEHLVAHDPGDAADVVVGGLRSRPMLLCFALTGACCKWWTGCGRRVCSRRVSRSPQVLIRRTAGKQRVPIRRGSSTYQECLNLETSRTGHHAAVFELHFVAVGELGRGLPSQQEEQEDPEASEKQLDQNAWKNRRETFR